ncbi:MAG: hypothetical protein WC763_02725 [Candidatus Paceibacterota bacterium]|jgi:hypothetical protein
MKNQKQFLVSVLLSVFGLVFLSGCTPFYGPRVIVQPPALSKYGDKTPSRNLGAVNIPFMGSNFTASGDLLDVLNDTPYILVVSSGAPHEIYYLQPGANYRFNLGAFGGDRTAIVYYYYEVLPQDAPRSVGLKEYVRSRGPRLKSYTAVAYVDDKGNVCIRRGRR